MAHPEPKRNLRDLSVCVEGEHTFRVQFVIKRDGGIFMSERAYILER